MNSHGQNRVEQRPRREQEDQEQRKRLLGASIIGSILEWYDITLYGVATAIIFAPLFFPNADPLIGTLDSFAAFAVGYLARPIGGIVFSHFGDKIGRKPVLVFTLLLMGLATVLIGFLPTYETIGIWAPILLVTLRLLQGAGAGAEYAGAVTMVAEYTPTAKRGFYASLPGAAIYIGVFSATGLFAALSGLFQGELIQGWVWRVPFVSSIIIIGIGLYLRLRVIETPVFEELKSSGAVERLPVINVIRQRPKQILTGLGMGCGTLSSSYLVLVFTLSYIEKQLGLPSSVGLTGLLIAAAVAIVTTPAFGALSDRVGRRPVIMAGAASLVLFAFPFFWLLDTKSPLLIWLAMTLELSVFQVAMFGPAAAFFTEMFDARSRYSGIAVVREVPGVLIAGTTPLIAGILFARFGSTWAVSAYLAFLAVIAFFSLLLVAETYRREIYRQGNEGDIQARERG